MAHTLKVLSKASRYVFSVCNLNEVQVSGLILAITPISTPPSKGKWYPSFTLRILKSMMADVEHR